MNIELFKEISKKNYKKQKLELDINQIKRNSLRFARKIEVSNYDTPQGFCKSLNVELNKEQSEKVGEFVLKLLEEELKELNGYLDKVEIKIY